MLLAESLVIKLSREPITKAEIRLQGCLVCSDSLLSTCSNVNKAQLLHLQKNMCKIASKRQKIGFQDRLSLNAGQKYCRMLQGEYSAILSTFNRLRFVIKTFVLSIFEWPFYTGFTHSYFPGPNCKNRHVRRLICQCYLSGFCLDGPTCKYMQ